MLGAGFTTVRNVGDADYNVAGIDQAIEEGWIDGPRIVNANYALGATGGHCDETYLPPSFEAKSPGVADRSEEHTSELQSLMRISYAVFCLKKKTNTQTNDNTTNKT